MRFVALLFIALGILACDQGVHVLNAAPTVTKIGPVQLEGDRVSIVYWIRDHEEDAVDMTFEVAQGAARCRLVADPKDAGGTTACAGKLVGGHGDLGVTSANTPTGRGHDIFWSLEGFSPDSDVELWLTATDDQGDAGPPAKVGPFKLSAGIDP